MVVNAEFDIKIGNHFQNTEESRFLESSATSSEKQNMIKEIKI